MGKILYLCLAVIGVACLAFPLYKKRNIIELVSFYLCMTAASFMGEYFILGVFQGYTYKPGFLTEPIADNLAGHLICNMTLYGGLAVLAGAFALRYYWIVLISCLFMAVEFLFLKLGIYELRWWKTYMTGIAAFLYFSTAKVWFHMLILRKYKIVRFIALYFISLALIHFLPALLLPFGVQYYRPGLFDNLYRDSSMFAFAYHAGVALVTTVLLIISKKWFWKALSVIFCFLCNSFLVKYNILIFNDGWNLLYLTLMQTINLSALILMEKQIFKIKVNLL